MICLTHDNALREARDLYIMRISDVAKESGFSMSKVRNLIKSGRLKYSRFGKLYGVFRSDYDEFMAGLNRQECPDEIDA